MNPGEENRTTQSVGALTVVEAVCAFEGAMRRLHPMAVQPLRQWLSQRIGGLEALMRSLGENAGRSGGADDETLARSAAYLVDAIEQFGLGDDPTEAFLSAIKSTRPFCKANELLYELSSRMEGLACLFVEEGIGSASHSPTGGYRVDGRIIHVSSGGDPYARGGYSLFVPRAAAEKAVPLVVAMHGGMGHGRDFLWTWLREAQSRDFILMAPTSAGQTWSLANIEVDAGRVRRDMDEVCASHAVDPSRILVTGISDGGTFALGFVLGGWVDSACVAPVACVLPPCEMTSAKGARILWIHGALDWVFPVAKAAKACEDLSRLGADVRLRIIPDLAHAYPREENDVILSWFGMGRAGSPSRA